MPVMISSVKLSALIPQEELAISIPNRHK